ncbi:MAG: AN1-like zinc finger protein [Cenarchaeum symbiont of Oopsacas minuta]|nr:AN1-like zinc finger protein [Cenarchaeum symbiont of Oopsacas minuta]
MKKCNYCEMTIAFPDDFTCKFCKRGFCVEHIQLENHECGKIEPVKFLRKTWLRRHNLNISYGRYIVVCDVCRYVSKVGSLIDFAGEERKNHIADTSCDPSKVFLEEDLSSEKIQKNIDVEKIVPTDRKFWVCGYCIPPQIFDVRSEYIAHHYRHN